jgi:hypothetical protein
MRDAIDSAAVIDALKSAGLRAEDGSEPASGRQLVNIFAKAEANGSVRGFRHTMLEDTDVSATRHASAAVGGLISGLSGTGAVYVSGGAEHHGPPGLLLQSPGFQQKIPTGKTINVGYRNACTLERLDQRVSQPLRELMQRHQSVRDIRCHKRRMLPAIAKRDTAER